MLQAYSNNISLTANAAVPFNNISIDKGNAERLVAPATIQLEQRGVYMVKVDGFGTGAATGTESIQLYVNGVAKTSAQTQFAVAADTVANFSFCTLVQVANNNCNCNCYSSPITLQVMVGDEALTDAYVNIIVTKLC